MLGQVEDFALSPTIDESGLKQLQKILDNFYKQAQSSFSNADFANFEAIASESDIARLKALTAEAAKYRRELETLQKSGSSERTDAYLLRTGKQDLLGRAQSQKGFDSTAFLGKNALAMERAAESYQRSADAMQSAIDKLESEANAAVANAQQAAQQVNALEQQSKVLAADTQAAKFHHAAGRFKTAIVANRGVENPTIGSVERGLRSALESVQANGKIATDARNAVGDWIKHLFPQLPTSDIASMVGQDINTLLSNLMEQIFGSGYLDTDIVYSPEHSAILSRAQDYSRSEINRIAGVHSTANVLDLTARSQQVNADLRKARQSYTAFNNEADSKVTSWSEMVDQQEGLIASAQASAQLSQELYTLADAAQKAAIASKEAQIQQNAEAQQDLKEGALRSTRQLAQQGKTTARQYQAADETFIDEANENLKGAKIDANEAEQFTNNLKQSVAHWMSAQQIVNLVKDGIRQAYQDIQGLDAAMTNIAVVTDMSVSDLWGKINEYMSIAQQYGVTTQGVYEVSQLYYQQGLSTNEVMAATTETLKMARIAGMGYAEAADAMTVAIRSFKMEMSDAGHVTDVYSKVAAVTASDTEELAIAMSKTASSAESVGSSFENTTAMLAVMIETTRESAQNLGSALKSIISRYGEMKSGMTQDSEGELIDYNKTDAALRSVGISLKDAQGQFRDFDDVIFELSAKWDSLDKNTQRYIATIMAGNRQQSRFIALVDNWERLEEVTGAAQDSEDAGLLQYAKTLDSLESKLNTLKTSFQQFYMSIFDGEFFKGFVDIITNVIDNLSKMGPLLGGINLLQLINQIKLVGQLLLNTFSKNIGKIQQSSKEWQSSFTNGWPSVGERIADAIANAIVAKAVPTGKQFAEGVVQGAQGGQGQPQNAVPQKNQGQAVEIKNKYQKQAQKYLKGIGLDFTVGSLFNADGSFTQDANKKFIGKSKKSKTPEFDNLTQSYQKQADAILKASDQFDKTAVNWANKVKTAGNEFKAKSDAAGKKAYLTALQAADAEAEIELAAAKQAAAEQKKAAAVVTKQKWGQGLVMAGTALSSAGMMVDQSTMAGYDASTGLQAGGAALSALGQGLTGNYVGAAITAITGIVTVIQRVSQRAKVELENAKKAAEEANIERAGKKESYQSLVDYVKKLKELEQARFDSTEAEAEWLALNNEIAEKYPELISYIDSEGNAIVNLTDSYEGLAAAKQQALTADRDYWRKQLDYYTKNNIYNYGERGKTISQKTASALYTQAYSVDAGVDHSLFSIYSNSANTLANKYTIAGSEQEDQKKVAQGVFDRWKNGEVFALSQNQAKAIVAMDMPELIKAAIGGLGYSEAEILHAYNLSQPNGAQIESIDKIPKQALIDIFNTIYSLPKIATPTIQNSTNARLNGLGLPISAEGYSQLTGLTIESFLKSGINIQQLLNDANSKSSSAVLSRQLLLSYGLIGDKPDESGVYTLTEKGQAARDFSKNELLIDNTIKNYAASEGNLLLYGTTAAETLSQIEGFEEILLNRAMALAGGVDQLQAFIEDPDQLSSVYVDYANLLAKWYETLTLTEQEILQQMMANSGSFTQEEMLSNLTNMEASAETTNAIMQSWYADNYTAKYRGMQAIWGDEEGVLDNLLSFEKWKKSDKYVLKEGQTEEEAYYEYTSLILNELEGVDAELKSILQNASLVQQEQFIGWWKAQNEIIEQSEGYAKSVAQNRLDQVEIISKALLDKTATTIDFGNNNILDISKLDSEARATLFNLITSSDIGTSEGIDAVISFLESQGIEVDDNLRTILEDWIYENINTRVNLLLEQVDSINKELSDIITKHEKGFSFSESQALLQKLQKLDPTLAWDKVFEVNEEGLIVLSNFNKTLDDSYRAQIAEYGKESNYLTNTVLSKLNKEDGTVTDNLITMIKDNDEIAEQALRGNLENAGWKKSDIDTVIEQIKSGQLSTEEEIYNYFMSLASSLQGGTDYIIAQWQQSLSDVAYTNITKKYTKASQAKNTTSASNINDLRSMWDSQVKKGETSINGRVYGVNKDGTPTWTAQDWEDYYTVQYEALAEHGASLDAFGNLIITDWEKWGEYIADSYGYSEAAIAKANKSGDTETATRLSAARTQILSSAKASQIALQETTLNNIQDGLENLYTSLIEDGEIEFSEVEDILTALQPKMAASDYSNLLDKYELAKTGTIQDFKIFIDDLANIARAQGYDINEDEIIAKIQDAYTSLVKTLFDHLSSAIEGSLSAEGLDSLELSLGLDLSAYQQQTLDGYQLSSEGLLKVASELEQRYGHVAGYAEKMAELFVGEDKLYSGTEELEARIAAIEKAKESEEGISEELEYQLSLLKKMAATSRLNENDPIFNFMDQDSTRGFAAGADQMISSIDKVKSTFSSITAGEQILADDFYNMMDFMYNNRAEGMQDWDDSTWLANALGITPEALNEFEAKTGKAIHTYEDFVNAVVSSSGELGKVDTEVLLEMGISMDTMSSSMSDSLQTVAQQQIDFLTNMRKTLEALQALDSIEDISIGLGFTASDGTEVTLANFDKYYLEFDSSKLEAEIKDLIQTVDETFTAAGYDFDYKTLFGENGFSLQDDADRAVAKGLGQFINFYKTATDTEFTNFVQQYPDIFKEDSIDWIKLKDIFAAGIDWNSFASSLTADLQASVQAALTNVPGITIEGLDIKWNANAENANLEQAKAAIIKAYKDQGKDIELELGENNIFTVHIIPSNVKAIVDKDPTQWNYSFDNKNYTRDLDITTEAGTVGVQVVIDNLGNVTFTGKNGVELDEATIKKAAENAEIYSMTGLELQADGSATANVNITAQESTATVVSTIATDVSKIVELLSAGITISVDSTGANEALAAIQEAYNALKDNITNNPIKITFDTDSLPTTAIFDNKDTDANAAIDTYIAQAPVEEIITILDTINSDTSSTVTVDITEDEQTELENFSSTVLGLDNTFEAEIKAIETGAEEVTTVIDEAAADRTATIYVRTEQDNSQNTTEYVDPVTGFTYESDAKGNVALAKGSVVQMLQHGAALAQGTLMGELGPELYVQGGHYYIAGANGPEFVDLAKDAIVFNHLQTKSLLNKGQTPTTGSPITSERRAVGAYATGNVSGSAFANGSIASAIAAIDRAIAIWENIANITAADFAGGGGGGGGGGENSVKAVTEELVKWYNLSRQIEKLEQDINNILAERENIADGGEYLRSLREQQKLLAQQAATQRTLLAYQEEQLERQKQHILNNKIWSQFLTFDESGNLQYIIGNESNGGQGQLNVLEQLNKMSGEEQLDYIKNTLGYSYTDQDGNVLDGEDLITKFFEELQGQIDSYDALFDTVNSTEEKLQEIQSTINEIDQEIEQNQMDLEQAIYDILVEAWEKQIEQMEEQMELVREANEAYIENLNKALSDERDMYSQNESIADRESLQNRLALLRRSGGSASEIYDLEQQLDDMLKDEYFNKQEEMIEHIEEANEEQIRKLEEQIKLEEEALEYQKENGVLWMQVYEIMRGTEESILAFMQGNSPEFFSQSTLQQKKMLTDWAKQIGIYTEDQQYKNYQREAEDAHWDSNSWRANISEGGVGPELAAIFDGLDADQQGTLKNLFTSTYANEMLESGDENAALTAAINALKAQLSNIQAQQAETTTGGNDGGNDIGGGTQNPSPEQKPSRYRVDYSGYLTHASTSETKKVSGYGLGDSASEARRAAEYWAKKKVTGPWWWQVPPVYSAPKAFAEGGLVDYTGPAIVHGSSSKPEAFLNAEQTAMISEAVRAVGDGGALNGIKATLAALNSTIKGIVNNDNSLTSSFTVAPGAITIQVAQLSDSYDVEELSKDVMNRMVAIAQRATNRGVNRR